MRKLAIAAALLVAGCAGPRSQVVFLDGENGASPGAVAVLDPATGEERGIIDRKDTRARLTARGARQRAISADRAENRDGALIKELPARGTTFLFYYSSEDDQFEASSAQALLGVIAEAQARPGYDIQIIGHADRAGPEEFNAKLSLDRAETVRAKLVAARLDPTVMRVASRGETDARGAQGEHDPADRYVEVVVR